MFFLKRGLPIEDRKLPAALLPQATLHSHATFTVPLSLVETPLSVPLATDVTVKKGETLYVDQSGMPTVSPVAGTLLTYTDLKHAAGDVTCAVIKREEGEETTPLTPLQPASATALQIIEAAKLAGIIDAIDGVPLFEKLRQFSQAGGCFLAADAVEDQPYASAAFCVLCEQTDAVCGGMALAEKAVRAAGSSIAVCTDNALLKQRVQAALPTEKLYFTDLAYPVTQFCEPTDLSVCRIGVQALADLYYAVYEGMPAITTVVTVAGDAVKNPQNVRVAFGTPVQSLLDFCGVTATPAALIAGDAITGGALADASLPVLPGMTCLLVLSQLPLVENDACIGCGRCAQVCHQHLLPYEIARRLENMHYEKLVRLRADACDGCGACSYVCPAKRDVMGAVQSAAQSDGAVFLDWGGNDDV